MNNIPTTPKDFVVVSIDAEYLDKEKNTKLDLLIDYQFNPEKYRQTTGLVVSVPLRLSSGIRPTVQVGDKIHFHFNAIDSNAKLKVGDKVYYRIAYWDIFCIESRTGLEPVGSWVICEPIERKATQGRNGIIADIDYGDKEKHDTSRAVVRYVNKEVMHQTEIKPEDVIYYDTDADFDNNDNRINGNRYFFIRSEDILCKQLNN